MPDPIEARMNFIITQQAQFTVDIQLLKERQADTQRQVDANTGMIRQLVDVAMSLAHHGEETDRRLRELAESGAHTDRRLDALIDVVDKLARRNGK
jgi:acyl transferase domain-containing protein